MASKLYVGGLSYSTTSESLREYFAQCGTVESATVITDRMTGDSHGGRGAGGHLQAERPAVRGSEADGERGEVARIGRWGAVRWLRGPAQDKPLVRLDRATSRNRRGGRRPCAIAITLH